MVDLSERGRKGGLVGGLSKSAAKVKAARKNGNHQDAGRKRTRTLGETLLRRKLSNAEHELIREAFFQLQPDEQTVFKKFYFGP
jgi:hypothetical protein